MTQEERIKTYFPIGTRVINDDWLYVVLGYEKRYNHWRILADRGLGEESIIERSTTRVEGRYPRGMKFHYGGNTAVVMDDDGERVHIVTIEGAIDIDRSEVGND